ncbi:protein-L-isoaspartate O-methyltransferase [Dehalococcoidia bacterium]|nr:protein-L-isoaspartate O-methyltransferase [Dehalococcoidia bacterium]
MAQVVSDMVRQYVKELKERGAIKTRQVECAFSRVERHKLVEWFFVEDDKGEFEYTTWRVTKRDVDPENPEADLLKIIYSDAVLPIRINPAPSSTSQPFLVAEMLELLELKKGMNVLEIGAGTGYNAALMQEIVGSSGHITTIDIQDDVVEQTRRLLQASGYAEIEVIATDGAEGFPENAPYDRVIATVGCPDVSPRWAEQLGSNGFMLIPLQHGAEGFNPLVHIWKEEERLLGKFVGLSGFMSIQGKLGIEQKPSFEDIARICSRKPKAVHPLPDIFKEIAESWENKGRSEFISFLPFMGIVGDKKALSFNPPSFWDGEKGAAIVAQDGVALYGDESLLDDLKSLGELWERFGRPGFLAWHLEFLPRHRAGEIPEGERTWVIERRFFREIARLA